jgi:hypothetical protein
MTLNSYLLLFAWFLFQCCRNECSDSSICVSNESHDSIEERVKITSG